MRLGKRTARIAFAFLLVLLAGSSTLGRTTAAAVQDAGSERSDPIAVGDAGTIGDYDITVLEVTPNADDVVAAENQFNEPPAEDEQFYIARISVTYTGSDKGTPASDLNFQAVGTSNSSYTTFDNSCGVVPDDPFSTSELFEGGVVEFNICWAVASIDVDSLVMYVEPLFSLNDEPVWFSLGSKDEGTPPASGVKKSDAKVVKDSSREKPIPFGSAGVSGDYQISVIDVTPDGNDVIAEENQFNDPPAEGNQFFLVKVSATYIGSDTGNPAVDLNFQAVGDKSVGYTTFDNSCGVTPDEQYSVTELFKGGSAEFNVCWQIDSADASSLVMYVEPLFSLRSDSVWFSLDPAKAS